MDKKKKIQLDCFFLIEISCVAAESSTEVPEFSFQDSPLVVYSLCSSLANTAIQISAKKRKKMFKILESDSIGCSRFRALLIENIGIRLPGKSFKCK